MALATAGFSLGVRPVASLRPHEETIPRHVDQLAAEMTRDGMQRDPIIIDGESAGVLDGMHRHAAFQKLGIENAVCCSVDYSSPSVKLGRWARVYAVIPGDSLKSVLEGVGGVRRTSLAEAFSALGRRDVGAAVLTADAAFVLGGKMSHEELAGAIVSMDGLAEARGWERTFVPEDDVDVPLQKPGRFVLLSRRITKEDVVTAARSAKLFPCKTSMHIIDPRPVAVNYPLGELESATTARLKSRLAGKEGRVLPPGSVYAGRRYKERLILMDEQ
ncbi:MAG: ParB N-terminal domain-containing protein [Thaumarchaeota archaeon]|nr:ParB N-terminal domain-containing protein [Nitrososphaerota archaeon]